MEWVDVGRDVLAVGVVRLKRGGVNEVEVV